MPQVFQVVSCYSCSMFQVKQQTKSNKWICKMCGEKQSLKKVHFKGNAPDCRQATQKLNLNSSQKDEKIMQKSSAPTSASNFINGRQTLNSSITSISMEDKPVTALPSGNSQINQWDQFLDVFEMEEKADEFEIKEVTKTETGHQVSQLTALRHTHEQPLMQELTPSSGAPEIRTYKSCDSRPLKRLSNNSKTAAPKVLCKSDSHMSSSSNSTLWDDFL